LAYSTLKMEAMLISFLAYSTLKMEAICSSETSVDFQQTTWSYIPDGKYSTDELIQMVDSM
jgi:hypothetical protein